MRVINVCRAEQGVAAPAKEEQEAVLNSLPDDIPTPIIKIDNQHDPFATVVTIEYGDRLGELLDTVNFAADALCHHVCLSASLCHTGGYSALPFSQRGFA